MQMITPNIMPIAPPAVEASRPQAAIDLINPQLDLLVTVQHNVAAIKDPDTSSLSDALRGIDPQAYGTALHAAIAGARAVAPDAESKLATMEQTIDGAVNILVSAAANTTPGSGPYGALLDSLNHHFDTTLQAAYAVDPGMRP